MKLSKLMMAFAMCAVTLTGTAQTKVIAHRGYWKCERFCPKLYCFFDKGCRGKGVWFGVRRTTDEGQGNRSQS